MIVVGSLEGFLILFPPIKGSGELFVHPMDTKSSVADLSIHNEEDDDERKLKVDDLVDLADDFEPDELGSLIQKLQEKKRQLEEERNNNNNDNNQEKRIKME